MRAISLLLCVVGCLLLGELGLPDRLEARPQYRTGYRKVYPDDPSYLELNCRLCHAAKEADPRIPDTKARNPYGRKFERALDGKNVKDMDRIRQALLEVGPYPGNEEHQR